MVFFQKNDISGRELLIIKEEDLKNNLNMGSFGHRKLFLKQLTTLQQLYSDSIYQNKIYYQKKFNKIFKILIKDHGKYPMQMIHPSLSTQSLKKMGKEQQKQLKHHDDNLSEADAGEQTQQDSNQESHRINNSTIDSHEILHAQARSQEEDQ